MKVRDLALPPGEDADEVWIWRCDKCRRYWLHVLYEAPFYTKGGHAYCALLSETDNIEKLSAADVSRVFLAAQAKFKLGSYFDGKVLPFEGVPQRLV